MFFFEILDWHCLLPMNCDWKLLEGLARILLLLWSSILSLSSFFYSLSSILVLLSLIPVIPPRYPLSFIQTKRIESLARYPGHFRTNSFTLWLPRTQFFFFFTFLPRNFAAMADGSVFLLSFSLYIRIEVLGDQGQGAKGKGQGAGGRSLWPNKKTKLRHPALTNRMSLIKI